MAAIVDVFSWGSEGAGRVKSGEVTLDPGVFEAPVRKDVLHEIVKWQLASRRQGTHKAKTRGEVSGGGKKPFKQKGTGNARQGSTRSPLMPGGAVLFGPSPRDYSYQLPKAYKRLGLRSALSLLRSKGNIVVLKEISSGDGKTKTLVQRLKAMGLEKAVLMDADSNETMKLASRNLKSFKYCSVEGLNVYDLLKYETLVLSEASIPEVVTRCQKLGGR